MRRIVFWFALVLVTVATIELGARLAHRAVVGESFDADAIGERVGAAAHTDPTEPDALSREEVIHPYLGYVSNPHAANELADALRGAPVSPFGLNDDKSPIQPAAPDRLVIGVFGGSVAHYFSVHGIAALEAALRSTPRFAGREVTIVRVALAGWKQPQQLLALSYLVALGAHFDVVINLDGFNEVTLAALENQPRGVSPYFPRNWFLRTQGQSDRGVREAIGEIVYLRAERARWAARFSGAWLLQSAAGSLVWAVRDRSLEANLVRSRQALATARGADARYVATGPPYPYVEGRLFDDLADLWRRSSLQMHRLAVANDIEYYHFLQPNQYVERSKPLHADELRLAFLEDSRYRRGVTAGYPLLRAAGDTLREAGVAFTDLTGIFADVEEPLYHDVCCHLNQRGNALLGARIGAVISAGPAAP